VHPGWVVGAGLLITLIAVLLWTFVEWRHETLIWQYAITSPMKLLRRPITKE